MDQKKAEHLQLLLDITTDFINEMALTADLEHLNAVELYELAVSNAVTQYHFITSKKRKTLPIGKVDTNIVAFQLHDNETTAILHGPANLLDDTDMDTVGGDESHDD
jgi:hypothetical protein